MIQMMEKSAPSDFGLGASVAQTGTHLVYRTKRRNCIAGMNHLIVRGRTRCTFQIPNYRFDMESKTVI